MAETKSKVVAKIDDEKALENTETSEETVVVDPMILKLKRPINFEEKEITEIDFNGLENLNGKDVKELDRLYRRMGPSVGATKEFDSIYLQLVAMKATGMPLEFFEALSIKDITAIEVKVRNFLII